VKFARFALAGALAAASLISAAVAADPLYHLSKTVPLGAPDRWDYVHFDPVDGRVYVAHSDRVSVIDGKTGAIIGTVDGTTGGSHGIATWHPGNKGYTDDGKAGVAVVFDLKTFKVLKTVKAEPDADGIVFDPSSGHILVIDGDSGKVTVIDPATDAVVATVEVGGGLEFGVAGDNGKFYVDGSEKSELVRIDTKTNSVDARWPMTGCTRPHGLAIDRQSHRLFASCPNKVMLVMNADTGAVVATLPIGQGTDFAVFDPIRKRAFSSNWDGTLSIVAEKPGDKYDVLPPVKTAPGARTMDVDPKTGRLYLVTADFDINEALPPTDRKRYAIKPGTAKLLIFDPAR
jgi:YVTN family beta-propeller protein